MSPRRGALDPWAARLLALDDLPAGTPVVAACSGGADSLALLALARARGLAVTAAYVDHGLRAGTDHDERTVREAAHAVGAGVRAVRVDVAPGGSLEARARNARYAALEAVRADLGAAAVLVGHTRDDQAETVLLGLLRGSATAGLAGMPARRGALRRPLLALRRSDTAEICARLRWTPVADPMNDDMRFRRVWLRREVIPRLERGAARDLVEVLARQADVVRDDHELLDELARGHAADVATLAVLPDPLARRVVRRWLGSPPFPLATVDAVLEVARGARRAVELPGGDRVERAGARLHRIARDADAPVAPASLLFPGRAVFGELEIAAWIDDAPPAAWPDGRRVCVADADRAGTGAVVRASRPGDRFRPLGRGGSKLVRDAQAEAGVPASRRPVAPVVAAGSGAVVAADTPLWVVGYRIDDRVRVTTRTRRYLWLSLERA